MIDQKAGSGRAVRVVTVLAVLLVAGVAAVVSYVHMSTLAREAGEGWRALLLPLSVDGLVVAASMVLVTRRRAGLPGGWLAWTALLGGVGASLAANVAAAEPTLTARVIAGWPALAFAVAFELLLQQRRGAVARPVEPEPDQQPDRSDVLPDHPRPVPDRCPTTATMNEIDFLAELHGFDNPPVSESIAVERSEAVADQPDQLDAKPDQTDRRSVDSTASDADITSDMREWAVDEGRPISRTRVMKGYAIGATRARRLCDGLNWPDRSEQEPTTPDQQADRSGANPTAEGEASA